MRYLPAMFVLVNLEVNYNEPNSPPVRNFSSKQECEKIAQQKNQGKKHPWVCVKVTTD
jgi:hypothetical protein